MGKMFLIHSDILNVKLKDGDSPLSQDSRNIYGGQAVIEGVMFAGKHANVTAVRRKNNEIMFYEVPRITKPWIQKLKKIPLLRGIVAILEIERQRLTASELLTRIVCRG